MTWACPNNNAEFMRQMWQGAVHWQQKTSPNTEQISCTDLSERTRQDKDFRSLFSWKLKTFIIGWGQHQGPPSNPPSGWGLSLWSLHVPPHVYVQPLSTVVTPQSPNAVSGVRFIGDSKLATGVNVSVSPATNYWPVGLCFSQHQTGDLLHACWYANSYPPTEDQISKAHKYIF